MVSGDYSKMNNDEQRQYMKIGGKSLSIEVLLGSKNISDDDLFEQEYRILNSTDPLIEVRNYCVRQIQKVDEYQTLPEYRKWLIEVEDDLTEAIRVEGEIKEAKDIIGFIDLVYCVNNNITSPSLSRPMEEQERMIYGDIINNDG